MNQPFNAIAKNYNLLNDFLSLGLHRVWKKTLVEAMSEELEKNDRVLDLATGTGDVAHLFLGKLSSSQVFAADPCEAMMEQGKRKYNGLTQWLRAEAEALPFPDGFFSLITCSFGVRNFRDRSIAFQEIARTLVPGGKFGILEIHPIPTGWKYLPLRLFWKFGVPLWGRGVRQLRAYEYLRDTAARFISPEDMVEELKPFFDVKRKESLIGGGLVTLIIAEKR
ncbi:MAG: ubiquinone/menaquinone biosynthesis methyltransferase [Deltaproteobacteria bacterium]|nr:ubiquinone/menaquinone biosynthesis methyltransferase [Deltaproteobacteria bacterium]